MRKNDVLTLRVEAFGSEAEGLCRHEGQVIFVPGALPGEAIEALIVKAHRSHAFGKLLRVVEASPEREEPPCPYYPRCGGCSCQHMRYEAELAFKQSHVRDVLARVGGVQIEVPPVVGMDSPWHYRNKASQPVSEVDGLPVSGFYARRSHRVIPVDKCLIAQPQSDRAAAIVLQWMRDNGISAYDEATHTGQIRHIMTRVNHRGQTMVTLAANADTLPHTQALAQALQAGLSGFASLCLSANLDKGNVILGRGYRTLWGEERLVDRLCGLDFSLSPLSFFQVNRTQAERLYQLALDFAAPTSRNLVFDLYCGAGTISSVFAPRCGRVVGIESVPQAVEDARRNAQANGIENVTFLQGAAEELLPRMVKGGDRPDIVVLDPPRKGAAPQVLDAILQAAPRKIVYVSCHPGTQARDARRLSEGGYTATACAPVDMFCRTPDVENVLLFEGGRA